MTHCHLRSGIGYEIDENEILALASKREYALIRPSAYELAGLSYDVTIYTCEGSYCFIVYMAEQIPLTFIITCTILRLTGSAETLFKVVPQ